MNNLLWFIYGFAVIMFAGYGLVFIALKPSWNIVGLDLFFWILVLIFFKTTKWKND